MSSYRSQVLLWNLIVLLTASVISIVYVGIKLHNNPSAVTGISSILGGYTFLGTNNVVLQQEHSDCGLAALANLFAHYGMETSLEEIKSNVETTEKGTSMLQLRQMAEIKGLKAQGWKYSWEDFQNTTLPAIVFVRGNHYVVVESIHDDESLVVVDPAIGRLRVSVRSFRRIWSGETLRIQKADSSESALPRHGYR